MKNIVDLSSISTGMQHALSTRNRPNTRCKNCRQRHPREEHCPSFAESKRAERILARDDKRHMHTTQYDPDTRLEVLRGSNTGPQGIEEAVWERSISEESLLIECRDTLFEHAID